MGYINYYHDFFATDSDGTRSTGFPSTNFRLTVMSVHFAAIAINLRLISIVYVIFHRYDFRVYLRVFRVDPYHPKKYDPSRVWLNSYRGYAVQ